MYMYKFGFFFSQLYFTLPRVHGKWVKQKDKDITKCILLNLN